MSEAWFSSPIPPYEQQRLQTRLENASKYESGVDQRHIRFTEEIAQEKTQYFEKLALGSGGTIALVVSFVGSHVGRLQPPWLLRSALVALVLAMMAAMYRNWKYPYYVLAASNRNRVTAKLQREESRKAYIMTVPSLSIEDGQPIDIPEFLRDYAETQESLKSSLKEVQEKEQSTLKVLMIVERICLGLIATSMAMLIALVWINF